MEDSVKLYNEDCLETMKKIPNKSVDMILCDLPYGTTNCKWDKIIPFELLWEQYSRIIKDNKAIVLFGIEPFSSKLRMSNLKNYKYDWIWDKHSINGFGNAKKRPLKRYENICVFSYGVPVYYPQMEIRGKARYKGGYNNKENVNSIYGKVTSAKKYNNEYYPTNILSSFKTIHKERLHPTQKPVELLEYLIKTYTNSGETVLDNCMGSGSIGVACINTNRKFIGIELDKEYFNIAKNRIEGVKIKARL